MTNPSINPTKLQIIDHKSIIDLQKIIKMHSDSIWEKCWVQDSLGRSDASWEDFGATWPIL